MLSNEGVRQKLLEAITTRGIKSKFYAEKINVTSAAISMFLHRKMSFSEEKLQKLYEALQN